MEQKVMQRTILLIAILICSVLADAAQTTAFTYQGKLTDNTAPASGSYQMQFSLWDASLGGTQIGPTLTFDGNGSNPAAVQVSNGIFTVTLNFAVANAFDGNPRGLAIAVKKSAEPSYAALDPRQPVTSAPYAVKSLNAATADIST